MQDYSVYLAYSVFNQKHPSTKDVLYIDKHAFSFIGSEHLVESK